MIFRCRARTPMTPGLAPASRYTTPPETPGLTHHLPVSKLAGALPCSSSRLASSLTASGLPALAWGVGPRSQPATPPPPPEDRPTAERHTSSRRQRVCAPRRTLPPPPIGRPVGRRRQHVGAARSTWTLSKLAEFLVTEGVVDDISHEGLRVLLRDEGDSPVGGQPDDLRGDMPSRDGDHEHGACRTEATVTIGQRRLPGAIQLASPARPGTTS